MRKLIFLFFLLCSFCVNSQTQTGDFSIVIQADSIFEDARLLARSGNYRTAISEFEKALELYQQAFGEQHSDVANTYAILGHVERRRDHLKSALNYYDKALLSFPADGANSRVRQASLSGIYSGMSGVFRKQNDHKRGLEFMQKALQLRKQASGEDHYHYGYLLTNMGNYYDEIKDYPEALNYYGKSKIILEKHFKNDAEELANIYNNFGDALRKNGQLNAAKQYFYKAIRVASKTKHQSLHLALSYQYLGETYTQLLQQDSALYAFQHGIEFLNMSELHPSSFAKIYSPSDGLQNLNAWANSYFQFYQQTKDPNQLYEAKKKFELAADYLNYLKIELHESNDKTAIIESSFSIYEGAIRTAYALYQITDSITYLHNAFKYSEQGRNAILREATQKMQAKQFANIPDSLLQEEIYISTTISNLEKAKFEEERKSQSDHNRIVALTNRLFDLRQEYETLLDTLEQQYPKYFALKYATNTTTVEQIQIDLLQPEQTLLEYFVGDSVVFAFVISATDFHVFELPKTFPLEEMVSELRTSIYTWRPTSAEAIELEKTYVHNAFALYEQLIQPIEKVLPEKLIIIPSGALGYLPFEALITKEPTAVGDLSQLDFLLRHYEISYSYSATLLSEMLREQNTGREVLAFAPQFGHHSSDSLFEELPDLKPLRNNQSEVNAIRDLIGGLAYTGDRATLQNFKDLAPLYKILHLATHSKANDIDSEFSYLAFSYLPDSVQNELLYVRDLYNMNLRADMVVLSACETGVGALQRGEGIVSLARGFSYAGAKSIVTTLWQVDDKTSEEIMVAFYTNLSNGNRKDAALRQAKLGFIKRHSQRAHPIFWAAYVPIGNMEIINIERKFNYIPWAVAIFSAFFVVIWLYRRRKA